MCVHRKRDIIPGFILAIAVGLGIWFASVLIHWIDPLVAGIVGGMLLGAIIGGRTMLIPGLEWTPKVLIPPGIILYGANLRFSLATVSPLIWIQLLIGTIIAVWLAHAVGRRLKLSNPLTLLLAVGSAVCGASAIVIASKTAGASKRDMASSLLVITLWGLVGVIVLPIAAHHLAMDISDQALLYATTLHQTGLVKMAALQAGDVCPSLTMAIKTARVTMIIPLMFIVGTLRYFPPSGERTPPHEQQSVRIPWYLWGFVICGICFTFITPLKPLISSITHVGTLIWTMAMVSIGLAVDAKKVISTIGRPLIAGLVIWAGLLAVFLYAYLTTLT